ncbi:glycosyltransferase family 4 protein [Streptomyces spiramenti]|uniref:D-inositol 3-phosphate glycosyltransferase n=1 Tax=Streptomyces spiramenti TaxID=2720606 RepID=A0ABX1AMC2_9ACTN|nr:glycosyltransferase family 4 protein [Streptomyces spiramenti]NJP65763.1 glycosyltransferase family 4 protein [Streptomyces spiramenti]
MRIAYLHAGSIPSVYANGIHVMRMCDAFTAAGHDVTLYTLPGTHRADDPYTYYGVRHRFRIRRIPLPDADPASLRARAARVRALLVAETPDLAYGRDPYAVLAAADVAPVVYESHHVWDDRDALATESRLFAHPALRRVVVITHALAGDLQTAHAGTGLLPLRVAPDCADVPAAHGASPAPELPGRTGVPRVGYVGHLYEGRGIDLILELAAVLPGFDFHLVGGTPGDRAHWEAPCRLPNVHFHGHRPPGAVHAYVSAFDVVLAPYQQRVYTAGRSAETGRWASPMKVFEYMAHGRAMIASDLPVLREVLHDRVNCLLRPPDDTRAWADAVNELVTDGTLRRQLGRQARSEVLDRYTWRRRADDVLAGVFTGWGEAPPTAGRTPTPKPKPTASEAG